MKYHLNGYVSDNITADEAIRILENEKECVIRARECDRHCNRCDLLKTEEEITEALDMGIDAIKDWFR